MLFVCTVYQNGPSHYMFVILIDFMLVLTPEKVLSILLSLFRDFVKNQNRAPVVLGGCGERKRLRGLPHRAGGGHTHGAPCH